MGRTLEQPVHVELSTVTGSPAVPLGSTHRSSMSSNTNSGLDAFEVLVRHKFQMFGPVNLFPFFALKGFALVEYQNVMDAVRARGIIQGNSLWGAGLRVKLMDKGLGMKGSINSTCVGSSGYIYVGSVQSCWMKDDVVHELEKTLQKGPWMVTNGC
ncbi:hypothetical protein RDI58_007414 [Solanum bulbocastanum]|uniref:RRM domain-containing protein n=1 Tax=Solanum bulbocastanum TaxID=147425 RepID=A0AAN8YJ74_SOLBU